MGMEILREVFQAKEEPAKGPEVGLCLVCFKNKGVGKTEWRGRLIGDENTQKSNKGARLYDFTD